MCYTTEISGFEKIVGYMIIKKSSFIVWWLVFDLLNELFEAHLPLNKTATTKTNNYKHTYPPPPPPHPTGIRPPLAFLVLVAGLMLALIFVFSRLMEGSEKAAVESGNRDHRLELARFFA